MKGNTKLHVIYIVIIVILLAVIGGGYHYFHSRSFGSRFGMAGGRPQIAGEHGGPMGKMSMTPGKAPAISDQQAAQIKEGTATDTTDKTFNITGGDFYFVPNKITVNKGDKVTFVLTNAGGVHDLVIDELGVKTPVTQTAQAATVTFTASKTGSFVYYCTLPGHRQKGMWGTLTVQ